jgi:hypothetical protein
MTDDLIGIPRFLHIGEGAKVHGIPGGLVGAVPGVDDDPNVIRDGAEPGQQLLFGEVGQSQVHHRHGESPAIEVPEGLRRGGAAGDLKSLRPHDGGERSQLGHVVLDDKQPRPFLGLLSAFHRGAPFSAAPGRHRAAGGFRRSPDARLPVTRASKARTWSMSSGFRTSV